MMPYSELILYVDCSREIREERGASDKNLHFKFTFLHII